MAISRAVRLKHCHASLESYVRAPEREVDRRQRDETHFPQPGARIFLDRRRLVPGGRTLRLAPQLLAGATPRLPLDHPQLALSGWRLAHGARPLGSRVAVL